MKKSNWLILLGCLIACLNCGNTKQAAPSNASGGAFADGGANTAGVNTVGGVNTGGGATTDGGVNTGGSTTTPGVGGTFSDAGTTGGADSGDGSDASDATAPPMTIIQEDTLGFCAVDGKVLPRQGSTNITGYTGSGFADGNPGAGVTMSWAVKADAAGTYPVVIRYAFGGDANNLRDARLLINGAIAFEQVSFPYTTTWTNWQESAPVEVPLTAGPNFIQLQAIDPGGLANIDYIKIIGPGITPDSPSYSLTVNANDAKAGSVSFAPIQAFYPYGTLVTLSAVANAGYFFESFTGDATGANANFTFPIVKNTAVTARFLPTGAAQVPGVIGYATVQDDNGTHYMLTGGSLGPSVTASTYDELKSYLESPSPYVVSFSGLYQGVDAINVASDKTLLGVGDAAYLQGIELKISGSRNVIIRNVAVSHVVADGTGVANDAIEITGGAKNIWIDHCELYADLDHGKDYYDGLLDIKNESSFITVSYCSFHDHYKVSLISSGDEQVADTVIRATYHHNYFYACSSRLPSIRFGKAHVFDNYYLNNTLGSCVNSRMGAVVKVENNYFQNSKNPIESAESLLPGFWDVAGNVFDTCTGTQPTTSNGSLTPPYPYTLDPTADLPTSVPANAGVGKM